MRLRGNQLLNGSALGSMLRTFNQPPSVTAGQRVNPRGREAKIIGRNVERT